MKTAEEDEEQKKNDEVEGAGGDPLSWANDGDANPNDDWGAFTATAKKGNKGKKEKVSRSRFQVMSPADWCLP